MSNERSIETRVPQGSVLGFVLYIVYTNDIPRATKETLSLYTDDAMFRCRSGSPSLACVYMHLLATWLKKRGIAVSADKSNSICFWSRHKPNNMVEKEEEEKEIQLKKSVITTSSLLIRSFISINMVTGRSVRPPSFDGTFTPFLDDISSSSVYKL